MNKTFKRPDDKRTRFWVAIYEACNDSGHEIYVADCLKSWFEACYPDLVSANGGVWSVSPRGKNYLSIPSSANFDLISFDKVMSFLGVDCFWPKVPGHEINDYSLDLCVTRDYYSNPNDEFNLTEYGRAFRAAKYDSDLSSEVRNQLISFMTQALVDMIKAVLSRLSSDVIVTHIPTEEAVKSSNLGYQLAEGVARVMGLGLLSFGLSKPKREMKSLLLDEKHCAWEQIYAEESFSDVSVAGRCVVVVDDLYQSGTSMWAYAKQLKAMGACKVIGVACVKSARDTDNVREG